MNHKHPAGAPVLRIEGLAIRLPAGADRPLAVEGIDLEVAAGQTLCVVGESGSGKSMIANAVMGLLPKPHVAPVAGRILFEGRDLLPLSEDELRAVRGQRIGMIFQEPMTSLNPVMKIGEQIGEVLDAHQPLPRRASPTASAGPPAADGTATSELSPAAGQPWTSATP